MSERRLGRPLDSEKMPYGEWLEQKQARRFKHLAWLINHRAHKLGLPGDVTAEQLRWALAYWDDRCGYCGGEYNLFEHWYPLEVGATQATSSLTNLVPACYSCNSLKVTQQPLEWLQARFDDRATIVEMRIQAYFADAQRRFGKAGYTAKGNDDETDSGAACSFN